MAFTGGDWGRRVLLTGLSPSATLSGFVALVSLDNVPVEAIDAGSNSALNGGGDLRFSTDDQGVNQLPLEVVSYVTNASAPSRSCQLWIRFPTYASGTREVYMFYKKTGETQPAVGASFGRNAVWVDTVAEYHLEDNSTNSSGGTALTEVGTVPTVTGIIGDAQEINSNSNFLDTGLAPSITDGSVSLWINADAVSSTQFIFTDRSASGDYFQLALINTTVNFRISSGGLMNATTSGAISATTWAHIVATWGAGGMEVYVNGVSRATNAYTGSWTPSTDLMIGHTDAFALPFLGGVDECAIWDKQLTSDGVSSTYDNQSDPATFWTTGTPETPAGGGVTVTADSGTYLYTGANASLLVSRIMQASSGSYNYTGTSINLLKGFVLTAQSGSYSYLGQDATLTYTPVGANILIADSGSYALTGTNINFNRDRVMIASSGSYLYQGTDIQITLPGQIWTDKPSVATSWTNQTNVTTIWTDK